MVKATKASDEESYEEEAAEDGSEGESEEEREEGSVRPLAVGDRVRVRRSVTSPRYGWGGITHESVGTLTSTDNPNRVVVDFPRRGSRWRAELHELERVAPRELAVGDRVRVRRTVDRPRFEWGGVTHEDVGRLLSVDRSRGPDGITATVRFPSFPSWNAAVEELEHADGAEAPPAPRRPVEDRARSRGLLDEYAQLIGMGFEAEVSLQALVRAARNHRDAERRVATAVGTLLGA
mmetsp:Transcript_35764/g.115000  ORF Transcript_35764/g.115000 Transcript_35764/m.115000 type:complete len:235 (-) Transcript_35764:307-1011(-)